MNRPTSTCSTTWLLSCRSYLSDGKAEEFIETIRIDQCRATMDTFEQKIIGHQIYYIRRADRFKQNHNEILKNTRRINRYYYFIRCTYFC